MKLEVFVFDTGEVTYRSNYDMPIQLEHRIRRAIDTEVKDFYTKKK